MLQCKLYGPQFAPGTEYIKEAIELFKTLEYKEHQVKGYIVLIPTRSKSDSIVPTLIRKTGTSDVKLRFFVFRAQIFSGRLCLELEVGLQ